MNDDRRVTTGDTSDNDARAARRRFLKVAGAGAVAVPVIESLTGAELLTRAARAQTGEEEGLQGFMIGTFD